MTQNNNKEVQYIWHDGVRIREDQLISMAKRAGSYALAEHYVCSLLAHGATYGLVYIIDKVNEIREHYQVGALPKPEISDVEVRFDERDASKRFMKIYSEMSKTERISLLTGSMEYIMANEPDIFRRKNQWQGAYMVFRDRLDNGLKMSDFYKMVEEATPKSWPEELMVTKSVFNNFSRDISAEEYETYYEMKFNPHKGFCEAFWEVVKALIMKDF